ncbi:hypothetical protein POM88_054330 [Heracleum sosnowskyi]|uniref:Reverse transcriptase zinc-binding domain-containing protein n=1 Tax=Heracleum sosnowskyi TaxID=360622 RepID=A0AAD8LWZ3_9APIA|nr:hypothetical protein POM88_054330 [Heracleum sosnowskyi]
MHHICPTLQTWVSEFIPPVFALEKRDIILWNGIPLKNLKTSHIWDATRYKLPEVHWHDYIWHKLYIARYAHLAWLVCLNRLPTSDRLVSFGLNVSPHCLLCVGGTETRDHLFASCPFSSYIICALADTLHITGANSWLDLLSSWGTHHCAVHTKSCFANCSGFCVSHLEGKERKASQQGLLRAFEDYCWHFDGCKI